MAPDQPERYLYPPEWFEHSKLVRPHILRLNGSYNGPFGTTLAAMYSMTSGNYSQSLITILPERDPRYGPPQIVLATGRIVSNPLATTTRLVGPRDTVLQLRPAHRVNLRVGKELRVGAAHRLQISADVFNVTNNGAPSSFMSGANNVTSAFFGQPSSSTQAPRAGQVSIRYLF